MAATRIRFGVGKPDGPRSAVWSLAWRKSDVYLIAVEVAGIAKISLHLRTGEFNFSYVREYFEANREAIGRSSRHLEQWQRPPAYEERRTLPLRLYVANEALKSDPDLPTSRTIRWIAPRSGKAVGFTWLITPSTVRMNPWEHPDLELMARLDFPEHPEVVWFLAHHIDSAKLSETAMKSSREFRERAPDLVLHEHQRLVGLQDPEPVTGARIFIEIPLPAV